MKERRRNDSRIMGLVFGILTLVMLFLIHPLWPFALICATATYALLSEDKDQT